MTRLTPEVIKDVPDRMSALDSNLEKWTGMNLRQLACVSVGIGVNDIAMERYSVAVVPITSGKGTISGFVDSVAAALENIGMRPFITHSPDVTGIAEAFSSAADIVFMADDERFIALNTKSNSYSDNIWSTARGFVSALRYAEGSLRGKKVLVVGAGRVGREAVKMLLAEGAQVEVTDILPEKAQSLGTEFKGVTARTNVEGAISDNRIIFNASPGTICGDLICEGAVISSPGVPYAFDEVGERKAGTIIHDVLSLGVAVMAVSSAMTSMCDVSKGEIKETTAAIS